jgi:NADH-ubiquinone oxidoreductase chain 4
MLLKSLLLIPIFGIFFISIINSILPNINTKNLKNIALFASLLNLFLSLIIFIFFDFSINQFQFVQEQYEIGNFDIYLGIDGISIYFVLLTTIIMPIAMLSN